LTVVNYRHQSARNWHFWCRCESGNMGGGHGHVCRRGRVTWAVAPRKTQNIWVTYKFSSNVYYSFKLQPKTLKLRLFITICVVLMLILIWLFYFYFTFVLF